MSHIELSTNHVHIVATLSAIEGRETDLLELLSVLVSSSQAEKGCIHYILHVDTERPGTFIIYEAWLDQIALDEHMATPHFLSFKAASESIFAEPIHLQNLKRIQ